MAFASHLHFEFCDSPLESKELLLEGSLFALQGSDLLLYSAVFCFLEIKMPLPKISFILHFFLDPYEFVRQTFFDVCSFHSEHRLQRVLLTSKNLHLLFVIVELIGNVFDLLLAIEGHTYKV